MLVVSGNETFEYAAPTTLRGVIELKKDLADKTGIPIESQQFTNPDNETITVVDIQRNCPEIILLTTKQTLDLSESCSMMDDYHTKHISPSILLTVNGINFVAVVDTGATATVISESLTELTGMIVDTRYASECIGVGGYHETLGMVFDQGTILADNYKIKLNYSVMPSNNYKSHVCLIGMDFFVKYKAVIDIENRIMTIKNGNIPIKIKFLNELEDQYYKVAHHTSHQAFIYKLSSLVADETPEEIEKQIDILIGMLRRIQQNPAEEKYRRIRKEFIVNKFNDIELFSLLGFVSGDGVMVLNESSIPDLYIDTLVNSLEEYKR